jgi:hypothetical protein
MTGSGPKKRFLAPEVLDEAAAEIAQIAEAEHVRTALVGGYALQLYGSPRLTGDLDVVAERAIEALPEGEALSFGGYQSNAPNGVPVDVVLRDDDYVSLYEAALLSAVDVHESPIPVVQPEYIAAMKMVAGRARDEADLEWLITSQTIDLPRTKKIVRQHLGPYAVQEFDRIVEQARWRASRE